MFNRIIISFCIMAVLVSPVMAFWLPIDCGSHSMFPAMDCKSNLTYQTTLYPRTQIKVGDIVVFPIMNEMRRGTGIPTKVVFLLHRVIYITRFNKTSCAGNMCMTKYYDYFTTKGDNNSHVDKFQVPYNIVNYRIKSINGKVV